MKRIYLSERDGSYNVVLHHAGFVPEGTHPNLSDKILDYFETPGSKSQMAAELQPGPPLVSNDRWMQRLCEIDLSRMVGMLSFVQTITIHANRIDSSAGPDEIVRVVVGDLRPAPEYKSLFEEEFRRQREGGEMAYRFMYRALTRDGALVKFITFDLKYIQNAEAEQGSGIKMATLVAAGVS